MSGQGRKGELEAAQQAVRFFEMVVRASVDGVVITDSTQSLVDHNEAFCGFFNKRRREVIETSLFAGLNWKGRAARPGRSPWRR